MNYNSIDEIFAAGTTNMQVLRNNSKQDDGNDTITGVSWFTYNGNTANTIYASGNSWIGFGSTTEHLRVNRIDGALYYLYREEGTLYDYYKFLKIRWKGYSYYGSTSSSYSVEYDVILWDTGDISLHMINIPTSNSTGTYSLTSNSTYSYSVSSSNPNITFKKTDSGFEVINDTISLELPYNKRYLIRSNENYYTINDNVLTKLEISGITSELFLNNGITKFLPDHISLLTALENPELLYWNDGNNILEKGLLINAFPKDCLTVYYDDKVIPEGSTIDSIEAISDSNILFNISFNNGETWYYINNEVWTTASADNEGMTNVIMKSITSDKWAEIITSNTYKIKAFLPNNDSTIHTLYIKHI